MEIICVFKFSSFYCVSPSHLWWPYRSLAEKRWTGQRVGCSQAPGSAAAWLWTVSPSFSAGTCICDPIYDLAEGFKPLATEGHRVVLVLSRKLTSLVSRAMWHHTLCLLGLLMWQKKNRVGWSFVVLYSEMLYFVFCVMYLIDVFFEAVQLYRPQ